MSAPVIKCLAPRMMIKFMLALVLTSLAYILAGALDIFTWPN